MITIYNGDITKIEWTVLRGTSPVLEDFSRADVYAFAVSSKNVIPLNITSSDNGVVCITVPTGLDAGVYAAKMVWCKKTTDKSLLDPVLDRIKHGVVVPDLHGGQYGISMAYADAIFMMSSYESDKTDTGTMTVKIKSHVATYGYDGLSAYEIAIIRGAWTGDENSWMQSKYGQAIQTSDIKDKAVTAEKLADDVNAKFVQEASLDDLDNEDVSDIFGEVGVNLPLSEEDRKEYLAEMNSALTAASTAMADASSAKESAAAAKVDAEDAKAAAVSAKADAASIKLATESATESAKNASISAKNAEADADAAKADADTAAAEAKAASISASSAEKSASSASESLQTIKTTIASMGTTGADAQIALNTANIATNAKNISLLTKELNCEDIVRRKTAVQKTPTIAIGTYEQYNSLVIPVTKGETIIFPSENVLNSDSIEALIIDDNVTSYDPQTLITIDDDSYKIIATVNGNLWIEYYYESAAPSTSLASYTVYRETNTDQENEASTEAKLKCRPSAQKCEDYLKTAKALDASGSIVSNYSFSSLVLSVESGDYLEFPSALAVGAIGVTAQLQGKTTKYDVVSVDEATNGVTVTEDGTLWIMYYATQYSVMNFTDMYIAFMNKGIKSIYDRLTLQTDSTLGTWALSDIIKKGKAYFKDSKTVSDATPYSCFGLAVNKDQEMILPSAESVGATNAEIILVTNDGYTILTSEVVDDGLSVKVKENGTIYVNYYFIGNDAATKTTTSGLQVTIAKLEVDGLTSAGKKVLWIGTSIPAGGGDASNSYPLMLQNLLGIKTLYNNSVGSSGIVLNSGYLGNDRDGKDLSETKVEKESRYRAKVTDGTITEDTLTTYKGYSYESLIMPYIDGTIDSCNTIVIDHGFNDREQIRKELEEGVNITSTDRTTFIGAFNYLLEKIYEVNNRIQIIIVGYFCKQNLKLGPTSARYDCLGDSIDTMLTKISDYYNFTYLPTYEASCINQLNYLSMLADGIHPHSDTNQTANKFIARHLANRLYGIL